MCRINATIFKTRFLCLYVILTLLMAMEVSSAEQDEDIPHNEVRNWALKFGVDLWEFGRQFTKMNDIKNSYIEDSYEIKREDGMNLLKEVINEIKNFLDFKVNAVMRIMDSAEQIALSDSDPDAQRQPNQGQHNGFYDARRINDYTADGRLSPGAKEMILKPMRRFEKLSVNLSLSSILVPFGIDINDEEIQSTISWSSHLDPLFANNLERDASLSWQYFGSSLGFMRRFPGTIWPQENSKENKAFYDFRNEDWFTQAATSPKDIMILLDASGSMSGKIFQLGLATVSAILDTLGDDDFVNLITFSDVTKSAVPCFKDKMVRATSDNIKEIKSAAKAIKCENVANFTAGFVYAFELLHRYNTTHQGSQCNQAIMLITDGTTEDHTEIIKHYNSPHKPVRIFTYLIGGDSSSREQLHTMSCTNKGFFVEINTLDDIRRKIFDYILVMARPMVLYQADHPVYWSPVFVAGNTANLGYDNEKRRRLVTTVSTPVFDRRNYSIRVANLLGVVGTDVPIDELEKVVPRHKFGVNGYFFVIDNNGRVIYHPDLRLMNDNHQYIDTLKPSYSSVDISEIEIPENDLLNPQNTYGNNDVEDVGSSLLELRKEMILQRKGDLKLTVLNHNDNMRRVSAQTQRYYYGPIPGTPFSVAIVLPDIYGGLKLETSEEIKNTHQNVTNYFQGNNWRVHPDWVYCEYNSLHDMGKEKDSSSEQMFNEMEHELTFDTAEDQVLHFLARVGRPKWKWLSVRTRTQSHPVPGAIPVGHHAHHYSNNNNNDQHTKKQTEKYFCDRNLIQDFIKDARITEHFERPSHSTRKEDKQQGYQMFGVKLSFVATRSGLLRWVDHLPHPEDSNELHFAETNARAIDLAWYKRAVAQHFIEEDSFVFSVPFDSGYTSKADAPLVTATHAIFIDPHISLGVVGLQFQHDSLARHFRNITSACSGTSSSCRKICGSDDLDCYILDNNGFVILSNDTEHTGKFFGHIDGTIMDSLVQDRIYKRITLMDYQGVCSDKENPYSAAGEQLRLLKPFSVILKYLLTLFKTWLIMLPEPVASLSLHSGERFPDKNMDDLDDNYSENYDDEISGIDSVDSGEIFDEPTEKPTVMPKPIPPKITTTRPIQNARSCDLQTDLYILQPGRLNTSTPLKGKLTNCHASGCERPFSVQKIPHSNLILLVVDTMCPCGSKQLDIEPQEIPGGTGACGQRRLAKERLPRRRPQKCLNYHPEEIEIQQCGTASTINTGSLILSHICLFIIMLIIINNSS